MAEFDVAVMVQDALGVLAHLPEEVHWICERSETSTSGAKTTSTVETRMEATRNGLMLFSFTDEEQTNQAWLFDNLSRQLSRCPQCVENYYIQRNKLRQLLDSNMLPEMVELFFQHVQTEWDSKRIIPNVAEAASHLASSPSVDAWFEKYHSTPAWRNAIHECFCNPSILTPGSDLEAHLRRICATEKIGIPGPAAALVSFLFSPFPELSSVARGSWPLLGPTIQPKIYDDVLVQPLEAAVREFESHQPRRAKEMGIFLKSLCLMTQNLDREVILRCLSGAQKDPIKTAISTLRPEYPCWPAFLRLMRILMRKLERGVWEVIAPLTLSGFSDVVFKDPHFSQLLSSPMPPGTVGEEYLLDLTEWMSAYVESIEPLSRTQQASALLGKVLDAGWPPLSKCLTLKEGMKILLSMVHGAESTVESHNMLVRHAFETVMKYLSTMVVEVAFTNNTFEDPLMAKHMNEAKMAAQEVIQATLRLSIQFLVSDFKVLSRKDPDPTLLYEVGIPTALWQAVSRGVFSDGGKPFCYNTIQSLDGLIGIDLIYPNISSQAVDQHRAAKDKYNGFFRGMDEPIADLLGVLSRCPTDTLEHLWAKTPACAILFGMWASRSKPVSMAAEDVLLAAFKAEDKADALRVMFVKDYDATITSLAAICRRITESALFGMMPGWINISMVVLDVLCDKTQGIIRGKEFDPDQRTTLRLFWYIEWRCLGTIFRKSRKWAINENRTLMVEFLRDSMDCAKALFKNFWTFEQALLSGSEEKGETEDPETDWTDRLLQDAAKALAPFTTILSIQDGHLLKICHELMVNILGLLDQKLRGPKRDEIAADPFFVNLKKCLYPQSFPGYKETNTIPTDLTEVQKTELSVAASKFIPDFAPLKEEKTIIELSDDEFGDISDADLLKIPIPPPRKEVQSKLDFSKAVPKASVPKPAAPKSGPLRVGPSAKEEQKRQAFLEKRKAEKAALEAKKAAARAAKPVTAAAAESSSDDESSDDGGNTLFKLGSRAKTVVKDADLQPTNRKKVPIRRPIIRREKDKRARIAPDLSPLYKQIFKWDYFHNDAFPPGLSATDYSHVAKSFKTYGAYKATFEPLLLLEAWQSFLKSKEEITPGGCLTVKISTRMKADNFVELETAIEMDERNRWSESDVVLLSTNKNPMQQTEGHHHCIARVYTVTRKFRGPREVTLRCDPGPNMLQRMTNGGTLYGVKIMNLVPLEREYGSLICLQYYDLRAEILEAKSKQVEEPSESEIEQTMNIYDTNEPQARAIIAATSPGAGFSLIQGPPGTGKTKTVIGIVGALLTIHGQAIQVPGAAVKKVPVPRKLLVCAPSNAAVDELVIRFKKGVRTTQGETMIPRIVRLGRSDAINAEVKDVTLEDLIDERMGPALDKGSAKNLDELREKHKRLCNERDVKQKALDDCRANKSDPGDILQDINALSTQIRDLRREMDNTRESNKENSRNLELRRRAIQQEIMNEAHIICATLSGSGHEMLRQVDVDFETVIIDEAAQSVELSALIPLKFGCDKCILVGDPQQLPPTVLSREAAKFSYEKSLFVRIQENYPGNIHLLSIQYRMHPNISLFPSKEFYNSDLRDGPGMAGLRDKPWHQSTVLGPYRFFDVAGRESRVKGTSLVNHDEIKVAIQLYERLNQDFGEIKFHGMIGIVTPYRQQLHALKSAFSQRYGQTILNAIEFNTVDAFQGREREIIMFSCVRAAEEGGIGFLSDIRRMNVGLTRAKSSLFVLGNSKFLVRNHMWRRLVEDAQQRKMFSENSLALLQRPVRSRPGMAALQSVPPLSRTPKLEVDSHRDPMDIDDVPPANTIPQTPPVVLSSSDVSRPTTNGESDESDGLLGPSGAQQRSKALKKRENKDYKCHQCGELGHRKFECPKRDTLNMGNQLAGGAAEAPTPPVKRPHSPDGPAEVKRLQISPSENMTSTGIGASRNGMAAGSNATLQPPHPPPQPSNKPPVPPPGPRKKIVKRRTDADPFIRKQPPPKRN